ncbi:MAG TPA: hypothetical protein VN681_02140, partial [Stellaceae bacterium]|nr:hypothetical protein [Stellaceae bacterium]
QRLRAEALCALGRPEAAESGFRAALAVAQRQSAKLWELRAATGLARLWRDRARPQQARALLTPIHDWFTEGRDMRDLKAARELLDELR